MPLHQIIFLMLWAVACAYAAVRGGAPERIAAGAIFLAVLSTWASAALSALVTQAYSNVVVGVAFTDIALFAGLTALAVTSTRFWPVLMASMQGCGMLGHIAKPLGPDIIPQAYYATVAMWSFPICLLLVVATWRHRARLKRYGIDYAWTHDLPRRYREGWSVDEFTRAVPTIETSTLHARRIERV